MRVFDVHTHLAYHKLYSPGFLDGIVDTMGDTNLDDRRIIARLVRNTLKDEDCGKFLKQMDEANIQKSVLLIADYGYALGEAEYSIEEIHRLHYEVVSKYPDRLEFFAGIDPRRGSQGLDLFGKSIHEYQCAGLKLYPPCGFELDDKALVPYFKLCAEHDLPVLTHTGPSLRSMRTEQRYPDSVDVIAQQFPEVNFILAHAGVWDLEGTLRLAAQYPNVYFDMSSFQTRLNNAEELKAVFRRIFDEVPDKALYGSDWPLYAMGGRQKHWIDTIRGLEVLNNEEAEMLFWSNAQMACYRCKNLA